MRAREAPGKEKSEPCAVFCQGVSPGDEPCMIVATKNCEHVSAEQVVGAIERGEDLRLLDLRSAEEWQAGRIPGAQPVTVELTFEALDSWPKETPIVFYSNEGRRSLDKAAYFQAYGFTNARSLDGGIQA